MAAKGSADLIHRSDYGPNVPAPSRLLAAPTGEWGLCKSFAEAGEATDVKA